MNQKRAASAYIALFRLNDVQLNIKDAYSVYKMKKQLEDSYQFMTEQEQKIVDQYNGVILGNGNIQFASSEIAEKAKNEMQALNDLEIDLDITPISITLDAIRDGMMSPSDMESLEGFVSFV